MRLFVAADLSASVVRSVSEIRSELEPLTDAVRWVRPESMHLTLKFIGEVENERVGAIDASLVRARAAPFKVSVSSVGFFPNARAPRVLWAGVSSEGLGRLAILVGERMADAGFPPERGGFIPHLTLARSRGSRRIPRGTVQAAERFRDREFGSFTVDCFYLYQSRLHPSGAVYTRLRTYALDAGGAGGDNR